MKEWILKETLVPERRYDSFINDTTVMINGQIKTQGKQINDQPIAHIALFTYQYPTFFRRRKYKIKRVRGPKKKYYYIYQKIKFYVLGEIFPIMEEETFSRMRNSNCFYLNSDICTRLRIKSSLITALCEGGFTKSTQKFLHSFVLAKDENGKEYVLDGTTNVIMDRDTYDSIYNPEIISCIPKDTLKKDLALLKPFEDTEEVYRVEYLCFPEQVISAVKKRTRIQD